MRYRDLREVRIEDVQGVRVWVNPSFAGLVQLVSLDDPRQGDLRGTVDAHAMYVWDAYDAMHSTINDRLNIGGAEIYLTRQGRDPKAHEWHKGQFIEGKGLRLYWNESYNPPAFPQRLKRLWAWMRR